MIALSLYLETYDSFILGFLIAFGLYFAFIELLQMSLVKLDYLHDFWNIFDFLRVILLISFLYTAFYFEDWH